MRLRRPSDPTDHIDHVKNTSLYFRLADDFGGYEQMKTDFCHALPENCCSLFETADDIWERCIRGQVFELIYGDEERRQHSIGGMLALSLSERPDIYEQH